MRNDIYLNACLVVLFSVIGLQFAFSACGSSPKAAEPLVEDLTGDVEYDRSGAAPLVTGTVIEASTGNLLEGVTVKGPAGQTATTDAEGHFELRDLVAGSSCLIRASSASGLKGENQLRSLMAGALEVVIYLR